jgi:hypothetical protein
MNLIQPWVEQSNYEGTTYKDYFIGAQRFYRAAPLDRLSFQYIREHLHGACYDSGLNPQDVIDVAFQDDCLVARYMVLVHKDFARGLRMAEMFARRIADKGYADPATADYELTHRNDAPYDQVPELPIDPPEYSGHYIAIPVNTGSQGNATTTFSAMRKSYAREREAAAVRRNKAALEEILGTEVSLVARPIDGIVRRWTAVRHHEIEGTERDPITR